MGGGVLCLETSQNDNNKNSVCLCSHKERDGEVRDQGSRMSVKVQRGVWESTNKLSL